MLGFGHAYVFYPEAAPERCTAALLLDIDPVSMVRGKEGSRVSGPLAQYVNDRPYVASSFLSVAIAKVYGSCPVEQAADQTRSDLSPFFSSSLFSLGINSRR